MKRDLMKYFIIGLIFVLCGCVNLYKKYYTPVISDEDTKWIELFQPVFLKTDEKPQIHLVSNINQALKEYVAKHYVIIGYSNFIGAFQHSNILMEMAKEHKATLVLRGYKHKFSSVYGGKYYTSSYQVYHQFAYFLVKVKKKPDLGFSFADLTEKDRMNYKSNTGTIISLVYHDTPAFRANLVRGDIIISCGKWKVHNSEDLFKAMDNHKGKNKVIFKIVRDGKIQTVKLTLNKNRKIFDKGSIRKKDITKNKTIVGGTL